MELPICRLYTSIQKTDNQKIRIISQSNDSEDLSPLHNKFVP